MTSNLGSQQLRATAAIGFGQPEREDGLRDGRGRTMLTELRRTFRPELLNRIDEIIVFEPLTQEQIEQIVDLMLARVQEQLTERHITLAPTPAARACWRRKASIRSTGRARCAAPSSGWWRTRSPAASCRASTATAIRWSWTWRRASS